MTKGQIKAISKNIVWCLSGILISYGVSKFLKKED